MTDKGPVQGGNARNFGVFRSDHDTSGEEFESWLPMRANASGIQIIEITTALGESLTNLVTDNMANNTGLRVIPFNALFDGTNWDRQRANTEETFLANAARAASVNSADFTNFNARGLHVIINVTAITDTPSIIATIQGKDPVSGTYYNMLESLPITTTGINIIKLYPGISAAVNLSASDLLPRTYRVSMAHADADSIAYSVAGALVL